MIDLGDRVEDSTIYFKFTTQKADGTLVTLAGTPVLSVYKDDNTTESTSGITLTVDFDSRVGMHQVEIILTNSFYVTDAEYDIVITTGTVNGISVSGKVLAHFTIEKTGVAIAKQVWDRVLTGSTHNVPTSAGRRLRQLEAANILHDGTAQAGASNSITLDTGATALDDFYKHAFVVITGGLGIGQIRLIEAYSGSSRLAEVTPNWVTNPDNTSVFEIKGSGLVHSHAVDHLEDLSIPASEKVVTRDLTEAYSAQGATRTLTKILFNIEAILSRFSIVGTALTTKKQDNSTAKSYTLNDDTNPTALDETG